MFAVHMKCIWDKLTYVEYFNIRCLFQWVQQSHEDCLSNKKEYHHTRVCDKGRAKVLNKYNLLQTLVPYLSATVQKFLFLLLRNVTSLSGIMLRANSSFCL